jgi:hypothetical protein
MAIEPSPCGSWLSLGVFVMNGKAIGFLLGCQSSPPPSGVSRQRHLSSTKLRAAGKQPDASSAMDKEVASDLAVVLSAGLAAERIAEEKQSGLTANPQCAEPDHALMKQQLVFAGLHASIDQYEEAARRLLEAEWPLVTELAEFLFANVRTEAPDIVEFIDQRDDKDQA